MIKTQGKSNTRIPHFDLSKAQQQLNLWQEIDGGKYQISCLHTHCKLSTFLYYNNATKLVFHMYSANDSLSSHFKKTTSLYSGNCFSHLEKYFSLSASFHPCNAYPLSSTLVFFCRWRATGQLSAACV